MAVLYRYTNGQRSWKTFLGGPGVHPKDGYMSSPDLTGDLVYSEQSGLYGAYFVVTAYSGWAAGHFGDSIQYVNKAGQLQDIPASSSWGCSHNTGIAFEAADAPPYASVCAEDHGALWLNTETQGMDGIKISNENVVNGGTNEALGGTSGSYSSLARFIGKGSYILAWVSRGAKNLTADSWRGKGYTQAQNRTVNRNVAIAQFSDKNTIVGPEAISTVGAADGDSQINWITTGSADCQNAHVAAFDGSNALVTWEEIGSPICPYQAMGCKGIFTGSKFQLVNNGKKVGSPVSSMDVYVAGDMVTMPNGKLCWPYASMEWRLDNTVRSLPKTTLTKMSFACMSLGGTSSPPTTRTTSKTSTSTSIAIPTSSGEVLNPSPSPEEKPVKDSPQGAEEPVEDSSEDLTPKEEEATEKPPPQEEQLAEVLLPEDDEISCEDPQEDSPTEENESLVTNPSSAVTTFATTTGTITVTLPKVSEKGGSTLQTSVVPTASLPTPYPATADEGWDKSSEENKESKDEDQEEFPGGLKAALKKLWKMLKEVLQRYDRN